MAYNENERPQTWSETIKVLEAGLSSIQNLKIKPSFNQQFTKTATMKINTFS